MASLVNDIKPIEHTHPQTVPSADSKEYSDSQSEAEDIDNATCLQVIAAIPMSLKNYLFSLSCSTIIGIGLALLTTLATLIGVPILYTFKNERILTNSSISLRWNTKAGTVAGVTGASGVTADRLFNPIGLKIDSSDALYIADYQNNRVQKWTIGASSGETVAGQMNGIIGNSLEDFHYTADLAFDSKGNIYVSDRYNCRVQRWSDGATSGTTVAGTGVAGTASHELDNPWGLALDSNGSTLYIADCYNNRVMQYRIGELNGTLAAGGNGQGKGITQLFFPTGIYFDSSSNSLVIANWGGSNIVRWVLGASQWTLLVGTINGETGTTSSTLNGPYDMTFDPMGNLYVADTGNQRIQLFIVGQSNATTIAGSNGKDGGTQSLFNNPYSLALDSQLNLYVADTYNHRVQRFTRY